MAFQLTKNLLLNISKRSLITEKSMQSIHRFSIFLENVIGVKINKKEAARYCKMSADNGNVEMMYRYGNFFFNENEVEQNKKSAVKYIKKSHH